MSGTGAAMLGLLGLLLGFTLSMAIGRWDERRNVIVNESNAIGFLAWSFGAGSHGSRKAILMLGVLIAAVLLLIMDVNRPQRGMIRVGVGTLERVQNSTADLQTP